MKKILFLSMVFCLILTSSLAFASDKVIIFGAASITNVMDELLKLYNARGGNVVASYAGSGTLAKQIESGAPASIFISANKEWADYLDKKGYVESGTGKDFLGNSIVLVGSSDIDIKVDLTKNPDLGKILKDNKLAMGSPESVPAGKYAKEALSKLGLWKGVEKNIAYVENVRAALALVSRGEAPFGIVFKTDAALDKNVKIIAEFPSKSHEKISYPIMIIKGKNSKEVKKLYDFLLSSEAKKTYEKYGFQSE